jgi:hypothetical protein
VRRAQRATPLLASPNSKSNGEDVFVSKPDVARFAYFQANVHWTEGARQGVHYAISLARRYAEHGDHDVSAAAMNTIISIHAAYVVAKGKTFFTHHLMFENPLTSDGFLNDTLEHLRQTTHIGVSRGDE